MQKIRRFIHALFQPDVFATFINYVVKIFLNPIIVLFVPVFLNENQQGYWYTFGSIAALTTFADLGFTSIMTQYVAHEYTYLNLDKSSRTFIGSELNIGRMSSLFRFVVRWMRSVLMLAFVIILLAGFFMFSGNDDDIRWLFPWILYVIGSVYNFASQAALSFFEGCDQFAVTQKIRIFGSVAHCFATIVLLAVGLGLYALAIPLLLKGSIVFLCLGRKYRPSLGQLRSSVVGEDVQWGKEFIPLLGRYAISWAAGYFASQIYNPLTFRLFGAGAAGRVGYSLSIIQAIYTVSNVWSLISMPKYNMAVEKCEWKRMDSLLKRNLLYSTVVYVMGVSALFLTFFIPFTSNLIWSRVVSPQSIIILCLAYFVSMTVYAMATYLRAHKQEPYMIVSILAGGIGALLTYILTRYAGLEFIFVGLLLSYMVVLPVAIRILIKFRKTWHLKGER